MRLRRLTAAVVLSVLAHTAAAASAWAGPSHENACGREVCACRHACAPARTAARPCHGLPAVPDDAPRLRGVCGHSAESGPLPALSPFVMPEVAALGAPPVASRRSRGPHASAASFPRDPESPPPRA
ncbi:MAG: hypothetical protein ABW221_27435 [Vicinamibacteria bacterium]